MLLHASDAINEGFTKILVRTVDTDLHGSVSCNEISASHVEL